jgi:hypothetical protein
MLSKKELEMTATLNGLTTKEINQVRMYGCTEAELRANIESSITFKFTGAAMVAASMMSDAQELLSMSGSEATREQVRQMLNQAKFALFEYVVTE